jgi:hypothetical protein
MVISTFHSQKVRKLVDKVNEYVSKMALLMWFFQVKGGETAQHAQNR